MPDLIEAGEADGRLHPCEGCEAFFVHREAGDMADLNNLCRTCAEECAHQLEVDYNLPEGCSDEERQAGMAPRDDVDTYVFRCLTVGCIAHGKYWSTNVDAAGWRQKYGRGHHCFRCGRDSHFVRVWPAGVGSTGA